MDCLKLSRSVRRDCQLSPLGKPAIPRVYLLGYCSTQQNPVPTSSPSEGVLLAVSLSYETASLVRARLWTLPLELLLAIFTWEECSSLSFFLVGHEAECKECMNNFFVRPSKDETLSVHRGCFKIMSCLINCQIGFPFKKVANLMIQPGFDISPRFLKKAIWN